MVDPLILMSLSYLIQNMCVLYLLSPFPHSRPSPLSSSVLSFDPLPSFTLLFFCRDFLPAGAVEIFNCPLVSVEHSRFTNNTSWGIATTPYSGNAGALAIGYNDTDLPDRLTCLSPNVSLVNVSFVGNRAEAITDFKYTVAQILQYRIYNQRGGGLACYLGAPNYSVVVTLNGCFFERNMADSAGGGAYMYLTGHNNSHMIKITDTDFQSNNATDGGGLEITYDTEDSIVSPNIVHLEDCNFNNNSGKFGGGMKNIQLNSLGNMNSLSVVRSTFSNNTAAVGAALYLQSRYTIVNVAMKIRIALRDW